MSWKVIHSRCECVTSVGSINCTYVSGGLISRKGARCGWGSAVSIVRVLDNLSYIPKRVIFSVSRNPRHCDSNCAISLMISSNPVVWVSSRSYSCGQLSNMLCCKILCI